LRAKATPARRLAIALVLLLAGAPLAARTTFLLPLGIDAALIAWLSPIFAAVITALWPEALTVVSPIVPAVIAPITLTIITALWPEALTVVSPIVPAVIAPITLTIIASLWPEALTVVSPIVPAVIAPIALAVVASFWSKTLSLIAAVIAPITLAVVASLWPEALTVVSPIIPAVIAPITLAVVASLGPEALTVVSPIIPAVIAPIALAVVASLWSEALTVVSPIIPAVIAPITLAIIASLWPEALAIVASLGLEALALISAVVAPIALAVVASLRPEALSIISPIVSPIIAPIALVVVASLGPEALALISAVIAPITLAVVASLGPEALAVASRPFVAARPFAARRALSRLSSRLQWVALGAGRRRAATTDVRPKRFDFGLGEVTPLASWQIAEREGRFAHTDQPQHLVAELGCHHADLPFAAFVQHHAHPNAVLIAFGHFDPGGRGRLAVDHDAIAPFAQRIGCGCVVEQRQILFIHLIARVGEALSQFAVVGQQDQTLALVIEPSNRKEPHWQIHHADHGGAALGIIGGRNDASRLVQ